MDYIEAGHGVKGWKIWLCDDEDLDKSTKTRKRSCFGATQELVVAKRIPRKEVAEM